MSVETTSGENGPQHPVTDELVRSVVDLVYGDQGADNAAETPKLRHNPVTVSTWFFSKHSDDLTAALERTVSGLKKVSSVDLVFFGSEKGPKKRDIIIVEDSEDGLETVNDLFSSVDAGIRSGKAFHWVLPYINTDREVGANCFYVNIPTAASYEAGGSLEIALTLIVLGRLPGTADDLAKLTYCMNRNLYLALLPYSSQRNEEVDLPYRSILNEDWKDPSFEDFLILRSLYASEDAEYLNRREYAVFLKGWLKENIALVRPVMGRDVFCRDCD